uniref:G-protein coupled receptors family 1 profile domain-containing protein n=2 Tax=Denticeps clupeoides TaxID=299321 RepID=A0AAY4ELZ0_9TELE
NSTGAINPRSFRGRFSEVKLLPAPTGTDAQTAPSFTLPRPALLLLSNSTREYLTGWLSTRAIPAIYILAIAVGVPANCYVLLSLSAKFRALSAAILYCSLAVSDILLLFTLALNAHYHLNGNHWVFGDTACRVATACFYGNLYCSAYTLACISMKRYVAVVHPFLYKSVPKRSRTAWTSLAIWVVFAIAMTPDLMVQQSYHLLQLGIVTCHDVLPLDMDVYQLLVHYKLVLTCLGFLLPLLVTTVCYACVVWQLGKSHHDWSLYIKASTLVFFIFILCFGPSNCIHFLHYVKLYTSGEENFYAYFNVAVCLCCLHCCLDPFFFLLMSRTTGSKIYFMNRKGKMLSVST